MPSILDDSFRMRIEDLLTHESLACMNVTADLAVQAAALLRAGSRYQPLASRVAEMLEGSILGELWLLNVAKCDAAAFILEEIAETALQEAVRAGQLARTFRAHFHNELKKPQARRIRTEDEDTAAPARYGRDRLDGFGQRRRPRGLGPPLDSSESRNAA